MQKWEFDKNITTKENCKLIYQENIQNSKILSNYNETDLRRNVEFAKSKDLKLDLFVDNVELLYDKELESKVSKLIEIGKEPFDIYLNPNILVKYNKETLEDTIDRLKSSGLDPKKVPLIAY